MFITSINTRDLFIGNRISQINLVTKVKFDMNPQMDSHTSEVTDFISFISWLPLTA